MTDGLEPVSFSKPRGHEPRLSAPYVPGRHSRRFWTEEENRIIRAYYPGGGGLIACVAHLPGRTRSAIYGQAKKLGVAADGQHKRKEKIDVPEGIDEKIRGAWPELSGKGSVNALADRLGVERWWLSKRALKLGLAMPYRKEPPWTAAEDELLAKVPLHDVHLCSKIFREHGFKRTPAAIMVRAKRKELSRRYKAALSGTALARILGVDNKTTTQWCVAGDIKATRRPGKRLPQQGGNAWDITREEARRFILENLERIDIRKVDKLAFVDLLVNEGQPDEETRKVSIRALLKRARAVVRMLERMT